MILGILGTRSPKSFAATMEEAYATKIRAAAARGGMSPFFDKAANAALRREQARITQNAPAVSAAIKAKSAKNQTARNADILTKILSAKPTR
jgi:hypothetical protein